MSKKKKNRLKPLRVTVTDPKTGEVKTYENGAYYDPDNFMTVAGEFDPETAQRVPDTGMDNASCIGNYEEGEQRFTRIQAAHRRSALEEVAAMIGANATMEELIAWLAGELKEVKS